MVEYNVRYVQWARWIGLRVEEAFKAQSERKIPFEQWYSQWLNARWHEFDAVFPDLVYREIDGHISGHLFAGQKRFEEWLPGRVDELIATNTVDKSEIVEVKEA